MNKVVKNYFYNLSYQILILIVPLITTPYVSRVLGAKGVGIFSYTNSVVQYFVLFGCIGLNLYGQREIAYVQHDNQKRSIVFWELVALRVLTVSIALFLYINTLAKNNQYSYVFVLMSLDILASMVDVSWFFQGIEDFKKIVIRNFIIKIIGVILIFLFVKNSDDLRLYVLCHSGTLFLGNFSMWFYIPRFVNRVKLSKINIIRHLKPTVIMFLPQIATSVYTVLDKTMIGYLTGIEEEVAFYEQGQKIIRIVMSCVTSLGTVMLPRVAHLYKMNEMDMVKQYLSKSFSFVFFLSFPMTFGLMALSGNIVPWFFGDGYQKVIPNMILISPVLVLIALSNIMGTQFLLPTGRQKEFTQSVVIGCIVNCTLNILLIPKFFSIGAAIATVIAELSVTSVQIWYTRKDFDFKAIILQNSKYILCSFVMFFVVFSLSKIVNQSISGSMICIFTGVVCYLLLLYVVKDEMLFMVINRCKNRIKFH